MRQTRPNRLLLRIRKLREVEVELAQGQTTTGKQMALSKTRVIALCISLALTALALFSLINNIRSGTDTIGFVFAGFLLALSSLGWWVFFKYDDVIHEKRIKFTGKVGAILGGVSFLVGFIGPIIFSPESNQGPLLGIFVTGPVGLFVGLAIGALLSFWKYPNE